MMSQWNCLTIDNSLPSRLDWSQHTPPRRLSTRPASVSRTMGIGSVTNSCAPTTFVIDSLIKTAREGACIMEYELRVIVEKVAVSSQEVVQRETITTYEITAPASI